MSHVFDLFIPIKFSPDYRRLAWVLTICAGCSMYYARPMWLIGVILSVSMVWALYQVMHCPLPHPRLQTLAFQQGKWALIFQDKCWVYDQMTIGADTGFFLLLHFSGSHDSCWIVIFYDQMSNLDLRKLNMIHKIRTKPSQSS